jgi:hypothetical protein
VFNLRTCGCQWHSCLHSDLLPLEKYFVQYLQYVVGCVCPSLLCSEYCARAITLFRLASIRAAADRAGIPLHRPLRYSSKLLYAQAQEPCGISPHLISLHHRVHMFHVPNKRGVCPHLLDVIKFLSGFQVGARQSPITHSVANKRSFGDCPVL